MPDLTKGQITKASKKHGRKFAPKYKAFRILQIQIEDVVQKSTLMWKVIYGLNNIKEGKEDTFEGRNDEEEDENEKEDEVEKEKDEEIVEKTQGEEAIAEEQQEAQSIQDTQLPPPSPPHTTPTKIVIVKDVLETLGQNINPLIVEDLKKILHQTTLQSQLCTNPLLVSVDELQKPIAEITREKEK